MRTLLSSVIVAVLVAGCSGGERPRASEPSPSPPPVELVNGGVCPAGDVGQLGDRLGCVTTAHSDDATLFVYAIVDGESFPVKWRIRYETDDAVIDQALEAGNPFSYPRAIGAVDVDEDGTDEWLIKNVDLAGHGTNWQRLQIYFVDDDRLLSPTYEGEPLYVNVGGISRMGEGARCENGRLILLRVEAKDRQNTIWEYSERVLDIGPSRAELVTRREGKLRLSDYNDPKLDPYYRLECGDLAYP